MSGERIAFIGLGNMGRPMASNLVKRGYNVTGFDVLAANLDAAASAGIIPAMSAQAAAANADVVVTMLPAGEYVLNVWREIVPVMTKNSVIIDCSTIDVKTAALIHELAGNAGMLSLDAPVSGGVGGAGAGTLTFMVGGADEAIARATPVLEAMGRKVVACGAAGAGQAAKICNNLILGISIIAVSEAFVLAEKLGLSAKALFDVASTSTGQCWALTTYCPVPGLVPTSPANNDYRPGAPVTMLLKDLNLARNAAEISGAITPLAEHAVEIFSTFAGAGHAQEDFSAVIRYIRELSSGGSSDV